jgi:type 1 fimbria pilin
MNFKNQFLCGMLIGSLMSLCGTASAQTGSKRAVLTMTGKIVPPACEVQFNGGKSATLTFNTAYNGLNPQGTKLPTRTVDLGIDCKGAATRIGIMLIDGKPTTEIAYGDVDFNAWANYVAAGAESGTHIFGLGLTPDQRGDMKKIGGFMMEVPDAKITVDGAPGLLHVVQTNGSMTYFGDPGRRTHLAEPFPGYIGYTFWKGSTFQAGTVPVGVTTVAAVLHVTPTIAKTANLPGHSSIDLDGLVIFELMYL